jgi:hypothetical protein
MTMTHAVSSLVRRVDDTLDQAAGRFPMYAEPATGVWTWSSLSTARSSIAPRVDPGRSGGTSRPSCRLGRACARWPP